jgi:hypothetical protein
MLEMHTLRAALMEISGDSVQGGTISARMINMESKVATLEGATQSNTLAAKKVSDLTAFNVFLCSFYGLLLAVQLCTFLRCVMCSVQLTCMTVFDILC